MERTCKTDQNRYKKNKPFGFRIGKRRGQFWALQKQMNLRKKGAAHAQKPERERHLQEEKKNKEEGRRN